MIVLIANIPETSKYKDSSLAQAGIKLVRFSFLPVEGQLTTDLDPIYTSPYLLSLQFREPRQVIWGEG